MKKLSFIISFILIFALIVTACSSDKKETKDGSTDTVESESLDNIESVESTEPSESLEDPNDSINVLFVGNSWIYFAKTEIFFSIISKANGKNVEINTNFIPGSSIDQHFDDLRADDAKTSNANIVIFNRPGNPIEEAIENIKEFQSLFPETTKFYMQYDEFDKESNFATYLSVIDNLHFIPSGLVHYNVIKNKIFSYRQLHVEDRHPSDLYGYLTALTAYYTLFDDGKEVDRAVVTSGLKAFVPGSDDENRSFKLDSAIEIIKEVVKMDLLEAEANYNIAVIENNAEAVAEYLSDKFVNQRQIYSSYAFKKDEIVKYPITQINDTEYLAAFCHNIPDDDWYLTTVYHVKFIDNQATLTFIDYWNEKNDALINIKFYKNNEVFGLMHIIYDDELDVSERFQFFNVSDQFPDIESQPVFDFYIN